MKRVKQVTKTIENKLNEEVQVTLSLKELVILDSILTYLPSEKIQEYVERCYRKEVSDVISIELDIDSFNKDNLLSTMSTSASNIVSEELQSYFLG